MTDPTPRDLIAEWLATDIDIVDDAYRNQADDLIDTLEAAGWHITHDPTPEQKAARIRKRRHLAIWAGWPRREPPR